MIFLYIVSAVMILMVLFALLYMALSPVLEDIGAWYRREKQKALDKKILETTTRYARHFSALLVLIIITSCTSPILYRSDYSSAVEGLPLVTSISAAWKISAAIEYDGSLDCRTPAHTYRVGSGDCKDISALMVALLSGAGIDSELVRIHYYDGQHMIVYIPGHGYVEPQDYGVYYFEDGLEIMTRYTLDEYLGGAI